MQKEKELEMDPFFISFLGTSLNDLSI